MQHLQIRTLWQLITTVITTLVKTQRRDFPKVVSISGLENNIQEPVVKTCRNNTSPHTAVTGWMIRGRYNWTKPSFTIQNKLQSLWWACLVLNSNRRARSMETRLEKQNLVQRLESQVTKQQSGIEVELFSEVSEGWQCKTGKGVSYKRDTRAAWNWLW